MAAAIAIPNAAADGSHHAHTATAIAAQSTTETVAGWPRSAAVNAYRAKTTAAPMTTSLTPRRRLGRPARRPTSAAARTAKPTTNGNQISLFQMVGIPEL